MSLHAFGTHQPLLLGACLSTRGTIVELGSGFYSTPIVHAVSTAQRRSAYTIDTSRMYVNYMSRYATKHHHVMLADEELMLGGDGKFVDVKNWGKRRYVDRQNDTFERNFGKMDDISVVFVDHDPAFLRQPAIEWFSDRADYIIAHDTEAAQHYGYDFSIFKSVLRDIYQQTGTVVVSNRRSCDELAAYLWSRGPVGGARIALTPRNAPQVRLSSHSNVWGEEMFPVSGLVGASVLNLTVEEGAIGVGDELQILLKSSLHGGAYFWKTLAVDGQVTTLEEGGSLIVELCTLGLVGNMSLHQVDGLTLRFRSANGGNISLRLE